MQTPRNTSGTARCRSIKLSATGQQLRPTESEILKALGDWLLTVLPDGWQVLAGWQNRTPQPLNPVAVLTIITRKRYATNKRVYNDNQTVTITQPLLMGIQATLFGEGAGDAVVQLNTSWRDHDAVEHFSKTLAQLRPTYASDPRQNSFVTGEKQYEDTWSLDLMADVITSIIKPAPSAIELKGPELIEADALKLEKK